MTNAFDFITTDWVITFAEYIKTEDGLDFGPTKQIIIEDCYFDTQAEEKFWALTGYDYENICLIDTEEVELTIKDDLLKMEQDAIVEHLFGTTQFGQTDVAIALKYYDYE